MMSRDENSYQYNIDSSNTFNKTFEQCDNELYEFISDKKNDYFTMPAGMICDYDNLYVGTHPLWKEEWTKVPLTILTNTIHVPNLLAVYFPVSYTHLTLPTILRV